MSLDEKAQEAINAAVKEALGETVAEIREENLKFAESMKSQHGSLQAAKAKGVDIDFLGQYGEGAKQEELKAKKAEAPKFAAGRAARLLARAGGNPEAAIAMAKRLGEDGLASLMEKGIQTQKTLQWSDFNAAGALIGEDFRRNMFVDLVYPEVALMNMGVRRIDMPEGQMTIPYADSGVSASYIGETQRITPSEGQVGQLKLVAKKLAALTPLSNDLLKSSQASADEWVERDMANRFAVKMDDSLINGVGGSGEPLGFKSWIDDNAGHSFPESGATSADHVNDLLQLQSVVADENVPLLNTGYLVSVATFYGLMKIRDESGGGYLFMDEVMTGSLLGSKLAKSTNIANDEIIFGAFGHVVLGETDALEITIAPNGAYHDGSAVVSGLSNDITPIRGIARHDMGCLYRGKEGAYITGNTIG